MLLKKLTLYMYTSRGSRHALLIILFIMLIFFGNAKINSQIILYYICCCIFTGVIQLIPPVLSSETLLHILLSSEYSGFRPSTTAVVTQTVHT